MYPVLTDCPHTTKTERNRLFRDGGWWEQNFAARAVRSAGLLWLSLPSIDSSCNMGRTDGLPAFNNRPKKIPSKAQHHGASGTSPSAVGSRHTDCGQYRNCSQLARATRSVSSAKQQIGTGANISLLFTGYQRFLHLHKGGRRVKPIPVHI